jgi:hypothetical protein
MIMPTKRKGSPVSLQMTGEQRYRFFLTEVIREKSLWLLKNSDGWVLLGTNIDSLIFPVWPDKDSASKYAKAICESCTAEQLNMQTFFSELENICIKRKCSCMVFPTAQAKGNTVSGKKLKEDIENISSGKSA